MGAAAIIRRDPSLLLGKGFCAAEMVAILETGLGLLHRVELFTSGAMEPAFRQAAAEAEIKVGSCFAAFRVAITGRAV